ncbi:MAG: efflux RND transporter periplasmic adaptor subunit [Gammaproteobacteria bacterium]|nr:efflux RND transporter periplasmic adaptor subunit [Gammaproteobacteria bacterium]
MSGKNIKIILFMLLFTAPFSLLANDLTAVEITSKPVKQKIYLDGVVEAVQQATLFSQTSGRVIKLNYDVDDFVKKGSVIAVLRDTEQKARFKQASAGLDAAKAQAKEAELEHKRVSGLYEQQLVAASLKDKTDAGLKSAQAQLNAAHARFDEAKEQLAHTVIRAPFSGTLTKRHIEVGETLQMGQAIVSGVAQQDALRFNVQVPQRLINKVRQLSTVEVLLADGSSVSSDQLTIFPVADSKTHSFQLRALVFSNLYQLYPGMFVKVGLITGEKEQIAIPADSVIHRSELSAVYIMDKTGKVSLRQVRLGRIHGDQQIVLAGLQVGEKLLTQPNLAAVAIKAQSQGE